MIDTADSIAIAKLMSTYAFCIDDADWHGLGMLLTEDVRFDFTEFGVPLLIGRDNVFQHFATMNHPIAHHAVNALATQVEDEFHVRSKMIVGRGDGRAWFGEYRDIVVRSESGLQFRSRSGLMPRRKT